MKLKNNIKINVLFSFLFLMGIIGVLSATTYQPGEVLYVAGGWGEEGTIKIYNATSLEYMEIESFNYGTINSMIQNGDVIFAGGSSKKVTMYNATNLNFITENYHGSPPPYGWVIKTMEKKKENLYVGGWGEKIRIYNITDLNYTGIETEVGGLVESIFEKNGILYVGGWSTKIETYNATDLSYINESQSFNGNIYTMFENDGKIYAGGNPGYVKMYNATDLSYITQSPIYGNEINSIIVKEGIVYVGGFTSYDEIQKRSQGTIKMYNATDLSYMGVESPDYGVIRIMIENNGKIYAGIGQKVILFNATDLTYITESPEYGNSIYTIMLNDNSILPPHISIDSPLNTTYNTPTLLVNINSNGENIWYSWEGTNITYTEPLLITFEEGVNTLEVWASDEYGNLNYKNVTFTINTPSFSIKDTIYVGGSSGYIKMYNSNTLNNLPINYKSNILTMLEKNGKIYIGGNSKTIRIYDSTSLEYIGIESPSYEGNILSIIEKDGKIYAGGVGGKIKMYNATSLEYIGIESPSYGITINTMLEYNDIIYVGGTEGEGWYTKIKMYNATDLTYITESPEYEGLGIFTIFEKNGKIYAGGSNGYIRIYNSTDLTYMGIESPNYGIGINSMFEKDGKIYVGGATTQKVRIYNSTDLTYMGIESPSYGGDIYNMFEKDGIIYVSGFEGTIKMYNSTDLSYMGIESSNYGGTIRSMFEKNGIIYVGGTEGTIKIYNSASLNYIHTNKISPSYGDNIISLFEKDGIIYVSGSKGTIKIYNATDLTYMDIESPNYGGSIESMFEKDNKIYVGGTYVGTIKIYNATDLTYMDIESPNYGDSILTMFEKDGKIYVGGWADNIKMYNATDLTYMDVQSPTLHGGTIFTMFEKDDKIYAGGSSETIRMYNATDLTYMGIESPDYGGTIRSIFEKNDIIYVGGLTTQKVRMYNATDLTYMGIESPDYGGTIRSIFEKNDIIYVGGLTTQKVRIYNATDLTYMGIESPDYGGTINTIFLKKEKIEDTTSYFKSRWELVDLGEEYEELQGFSKFITLPLVEGGNYDFFVNWGDNTSSYINSWDSINKTHLYSELGIYEITILGTIEGLNFGDLYWWDSQKIIEITQWGNLKLISSNPSTDKGRYFDTCLNLKITATDILNTTGITNMYSMFYGGKGFSILDYIPNINKWDFSLVNDMSFMFAQQTYFSQPLNNIDISNVKDIEGMFIFSEGFNEALYKWNISNVISAENIFYETSLNITNYDLILTSWGKQDVKTNVNLGTIDSYYCLGKKGRDRLVNEFGWTINDKGLNCSGISLSPIFIDIISPIEKTYYVNEILLEITSNGEEIWYSFEDINVSYTEPIYVSFNEGVNTLEVWASDEYNNINYTNITFTIDSFVSPPFEITINSPLNQTYNYSEISIDITANQEGNIWYNWNGTTISYDGKTDIYFPDGTHTLYVWGENLEEEGDNKNMTFTIDTFVPPTPIEIIINSPFNKTYYYNNILIDLEIIGDYNNVWYNWNGTNVSYTEPHLITFEEGSNTLEIWASDMVGLLYYKNITFTVDIPIPFEIIILSPFNRTYYDSEITIDIITNQKGNIWYDWNGTTMFYTGKTDVYFPDGTHTLHVWGEDYLWGMEDYKNVTFTIDTFVPSPFEITINSPINQTYNDRLITIDITSNQDGRIWYNWEGTNVSYVDKTTISFPDGTHILEVWGEDLIGEEDYKNVTFTVDIPTCQKENILYVGGSKGTIKIYNATDLTYTNFESINYGDEIHTILEKEGILYVGGYMRTIKIYNATSLEYMDIESPKLLGYIFSMVEKDGKIYAGGSWGTIKIYNATDLSYMGVESPDIGGHVLSMIEKDDIIYTGGMGNFGEGEYIKMYNATDLTYITKSPKYGNIIKSMFEKEGILYVGGYTRTIKMYNSTDLTYMNIQSPDYGNVINTIFEKEGIIYVGGDGGIIKMYNSTDLTYMNIQSSNYGGDIHSLFEHEGIVYAGGSIGTIKIYNATDLSYMGVESPNYGGNINYIAFKFKPVPKIIINSPIKGHYYNTNTILLNISFEKEDDAIWYDWNGTNITYTEPLLITFNEGENKLKVYARDSEDNVGDTTLTFFVDTLPPQNVTNYMSSYDFTIPTNITFYCSYTDSYGKSAIGKIYWADGTNETFDLINITFFNENPIIFSKEVEIEKIGIHNWTCIAIDSAGNTNYSSSQQFISGELDVISDTTITPKKIFLSYDKENIIEGYDYNYTDSKGNTNLYFDFIKKTNITYYGEALPSIKLYRNVILDTNNLIFHSLTDMEGNYYSYSLLNKSGYLNVEYNVTYNNTIPEIRLLNYSIPVKIEWDTLGNYRYVNIINERIIEGKYLTIGLHPNEEWNATKQRINIEVFFEGRWFTLGSYSTCEETNMSSWGVYDVITWDSDGNGLKDTLNLSIDLNATLPKTMRFSLIGDRESPCGAIIITPTPPTPSGGSGGELPSEGGGGGISIITDIFKELPSEAEIKETFINLDAFLKKLVFGIPFAVLLGFVGLFYAGIRYQRGKIDAFIFIGMIGGLTLILTYI